MGVADLLLNRITSPPYCSLNCRYPSTWPHGLPVVASPIRTSIACSSIQGKTEMEV
jgi:hypothetical protein